MANIRIYDQRIAAEGSIPGRAATADDFGGGIGEGLVAIGHTGMALYEKRQRDEEKRKHDEEKLLNKQKQDELLRFSVEVAKGRAQWQEWMVDAQEKSPADPTGFTRRFNEEFTRYKDKALEAASFPETKLRYEAELESMRASLTDNAIRFETAAKAKFQTNSVRVAFGANENSVRASPATLPEVLAQDERMVDGLQIPATTRDHLKIERSQALHNAAVEGNIALMIDAKNVSLMQAYYDELKKTPLWKEKLAPKDYENALKTLQSAMDTLGRADLRHQAEALTERMREREAGVNNGLSPAEAGFIPDPVDRARAQAQIDTANLIGDAAEKIKLMPLPDLLAHIKSLQAKVTDPGNFTNEARELSAAVTAANARIKAFSDDAAAYVQTNSPVVQQAYEQFAQNATPAAADQYAKAVIAEQSRLHPGVPPVILSATQMGQIKVQFAEISVTPEGADKALQLLQSQAKLWGNHWPAVYRQLAQEKVLSAPQRMAARMMEPTRQATARLLLEAASVGEKEMMKQLNLPELNKDMKAVITDALTPFQVAMRYQSNGAKAFGDAADSVELLALKYMTLGEKNVATAVERAAKAIILDDYHFRGTYFIPRNEDLTSVEKGLRAATRIAPDLKIVPPTDLTGLRPEDIQNGMKDALKSGAVWVTNDDATGVVLAWPNARRERVMVSEEDGAVPLQYTWAQLKQMSILEDPVRRNSGTATQKLLKNPWEHGYR